jgi:hypothetical protein
MDASKLIDDCSTLRQNLVCFCFNAVSVIAFWRMSVLF